MKSIAFIPLNRIPYFCTLLLALFPALPIKFQSIAIIIFIAASLTQIPNLKSMAVKNKAIWVLLFSFIPLLYALYIFISDDFSSALFQTEKRLSLIIIPLAFLFWSHPLKEKEMQKVKIVFVAACLLVVLKLYIVFLLTGLIQKAWHDENFYFVFRTAVEEISGFHPSYLALYISFSICIILIQLLFPHTIIKRNWIIASVLGLVLFSSVLWLLAARMPLFALMIAITLILFWKLKGTLKFSVLAFILLAAITLSVLVSPTLKNRVGQLFTTGLSKSQQEDFNETNIRLAIYSCSFKLIKNNWISGYGPGDIYTSLNACYNKEFNSDKLKSKNYNTHNEYLNMWIGCGIVGILLFLLMLWLPLKVAIDSNHKLYILFILLFAMSCLTENVLSRQHGVVFYSVINSLLFFNEILKWDFSDSSHTQ